MAQHVSRDSHIDIRLLPFILMRVDKTILFENAKGWNLIANGLKCGIPLEPSIALAEQECQIAALRPQFLALISECEARNGARPAKSAKFNLIPEQVFELVYLGWITGTLDIQLLRAVSWMRAQLAFAKEPAFLQQMEDALLAGSAPNQPVPPSGSPDRILENCERRLNTEFPIPESAEGRRFRDLAAEVENGANPDKLIDASSLSPLAKAYYQQGYNSGMLELSLRRLADVIDMNQSTLVSLY